MRIAFYAPMKPMDDPEPSGDRRVARAFANALTNLGHDVFQASTFRSYEGTGSEAEQTAIKKAAFEAHEPLIEQLVKSPPDVWFTYHVYHKSPDWLGPGISDFFDIPYVIAEASHAPKQIDGSWKVGFEGAAKAICRADAIISVNPTDEPCLTTLRGGRSGLYFIPPFIENDRPSVVLERSHLRERLAAEQGFDATVPWLLCVAMMRPGAKQDSYKVLSDALPLLSHQPVNLLIAGSGPDHSTISNLFRNAPNVHFLGECHGDMLKKLYTAADLFVWPAVREGFGMALLEAQAAGLPVVAGYTPGVATIIDDGTTGLLTTPGDPRSFAQAVDRLLHHSKMRSDMSTAAERKALQTHSSQVAEQRLRRILEDLRTETAA